MGGDEVADEGEDGHDDVFGNGDDIGASHLGNGDAAVGLVGGIEVDVVGSNSGSDGQFELLCFCEALFRQVAWMEAD